MFTPVFTTPGKGNEKGSVENLVGMARRTFMVPIPQAPTIDALNATLQQQCTAHLEQRMAGRTASIAMFLQTEQRYPRPLPEHSLDVRVSREVVASSTARVTFQTNHYSVPVGAAYARLTLKADPFRVHMYHSETLVADHPRSYGRTQVIEDWRHYVPVLLRKPGAVPFAGPLRHAELPRIWAAFHQELLQRRSDGNREFVRLLQLGLSYPLDDVTAAALQQAATVGAYSVDAVQPL